MSRAVSFRWRCRGSVRASVLVREIHSRLTEPRAVASGIKHNNPLTTVRGSVSASLFARMIRRARERAGLDVLESHIHPDLAPASELFRSDVAFNRQAARVRLQVLTDRHDIA